MPIFIGWFLHDDYRGEAPAGWRPPDAFAVYGAAHGLDRGQLYWAWAKNAELALAEGLATDDLCWRFRQEYPATAEEAFQTSGDDSFIPSSLVLAARKFEAPPQGFAEHPLTHRRAVLNLAPPGQEAKLAAMVAEGEGMRGLTPAEACALCPALKPSYVAAAAIEEDAFDIDVHALHQGYLRQLRARGGQVVTDARAETISRRDGTWEVATPAGAFSAPLLVNAAGAWGDVVARMAGAAPIGLTPMRRTALLVDGPPGHDPSDWPLVGDAAHTWMSSGRSRRLRPWPASGAGPVWRQALPPTSIRLSGPSAASRRAGRKLLRPRNSATNRFSGRS